MGTDPRPALGSFARPETPVPGLAASVVRTCPHCGSARLTHIRMRTPGGVDAVFVACLACEQTGWFAARDGAPLTADQVGSLGTQQ